MNTMTRRWKIGNGIKLMQEMGKDSVDLVFTSPPFKDEDVNGEYWGFYDKFFNEAMRIAKNAVIIIHSATRLNDVVCRYPPKRVLIWGKGVVKYAWRYNPIYVYQIGDHYKVNKYIWSDVFGVSPLYGSKKAHKYQDPVILYSTILGMFKDCKSVCDPFLGGGTTLDACSELDISCIGFEIDPQWEFLYNNLSVSRTPSLTPYLGAE